MIADLLSRNAFALPRLRIWIHALLGGRRPLDFFIGLLAAVSALLLLLSILLWISGRATPNFEALEEEAQRALARRDVENARVCILRLRNLAPSEKRSALMQAKLLQLLGNHDEAVFLLRSLVEPGRDVALDVRLALAEALILGPRADTDAGQELLRQALEAAPDDPAVHEVAARVALVREDWRLVLGHLEATPLASRPDLRVLQAIALWNLGDTRKAARLAREIEDLRRLQLADMDDKPEHDTLMATALGIQGEFERALGWVPSGEASNAAWYRIRCDLLAGLAVKLADATFPRPVPGLAALEESLLMDPGHRLSLRTLARISLVIAQDAARFEENRLRLLDAAPDSPGEAFLAWYTACRAQLSGDVQAATASLTAALGSPEVAFIIGRLAWNITLEATGDTRLLELLLQASRRLAGGPAAGLASPELEGRLLVSLQRWQEASLALRQTFSEGPPRLADTARITRDVWERLALEAWRDGNRARARALFEDAHYLTLDSGRLERNLALCSALYDTEPSDWLSALEALDRLATAEDRAHPEWNAWRALLKFRLGDQGESVKLLVDKMEPWDRSYPKPQALSPLYQRARGQSLPAADP